VVGPAVADDRVEAGRRVDERCCDLRRIAHHLGEIAGRHVEAGPHRERHKDDQELAAHQGGLADIEKRLAPDEQRDKDVGADAHHAQEFAPHLLVALLGNHLDPQARGFADHGVLRVAEHLELFVEQEGHRPRDDEAAQVGETEQAVVAQQAAGDDGDLDDHGRKAGQDVIDRVGDAADGIDRLGIGRAGRLGIGPLAQVRDVQDELDPLAKVGLVEHLVAQHHVGAHQAGVKGAGGEQEPHRAAQVAAVEAIDELAQQVDRPQGGELLEDGHDKDGEAVPAVLPDQAGDVADELPQGVVGKAELDSFCDALGPRPDAPEQRGQWALLGILYNR